MPGEPVRIVAPEDIRSKLNNSGTTIAANTVVKLDTDEDEIILPAATTDRCLGVTMAAIANGAWGPVQIRGKALCRAHGALATLGVALMPTTAGRVDTWAAAGGTNAALIGNLELTAGAQDDVVEVELAGPFSLQQG